jgi:hypothetical protein
MTTLHKYRADQSHVSFADGGAQSEQNLTHDSHHKPQTPGPADPTLLGQNLDRVSAGCKNVMKLSFINGGDPRRTSYLHSSNSQGSRQHVSSA